MADKASDKGQSKDNGSSTRITESSVAEFLREAAKTGAPIRFVDQNDKVLMDLTPAEGGESAAARQDVAQLPYMDRAYQIMSPSEYSPMCGLSGRAFNSARAKIAKAQEFYTRDSLTRRLTDLQAQFASTPLQLKGPQKHAKFFKQWVKLTKLENHFFKWFYKEYFLSGNVHIIRNRIPFKGKLGKKVGQPTLKMDGKSFRTDRSNQSLISFSDGEYADLKKDFAKHLLTEQQALREETMKSVTYTDVADIAAAKLNWTNKMLPVGYTVLNPMEVSKLGSPEFGLEQVIWSPGANLKSQITKNSAKFRSIVKTMPVMLLKQIENGSKRIELFDDFYTGVYRMKQPYESYAEPMMTGVFTHISRKDKLRAAETKVIDSVINKILLVRVGDKDYPASAAQLKTISSILKNPSSVLELIWNHAIDMKWVDVDTEFLAPEKYKSVNADIMEGWGITPVLLGNTADTQGNQAYVSLRGLIENLKDGQDAASSWLQDEFNSIAEVLQLDSAPEPEFTTIDLEDKVQVYKIFQGMVDRGILSNATVCEQLGEDWDRELDRIKDESKLRQDGVLPTIGSPYQKGDDNKSVNEDGDPVDPEDPEANADTKPKMTPAEQKGSQGRPPGTSTPMPGRKKKAVLNAASAKTEVVDVLFSRFKDAGSTEDEAYAKTSQALYALKPGDMEEVDLSTFEADPAVYDTAEAKELVKDMYTFAKQANVKWKVNNDSKEVPMTASLQILADAWVFCSL